MIIDNEKIEKLKNKQIEDLKVHEILKLLVEDDVNSDLLRILKLLLDSEIPDKFNNNSEILEKLKNKTDSNKAAEQNLLKKMSNMINKTQQPPRNLENIEEENNNEEKNNKELTQESKQNKNGEYGDDFKSIKSKNTNDFIEEIRHILEVLKRENCNIIINKFIKNINIILDKNGIKQIEIEYTKNNNTTEMSYSSETKILDLLNKSNNLRKFICKIINLYNPVIKKLANGQMPHIKDFISRFGEIFRQTVSYSSAISYCVTRIPNKPYFKKQPRIIQFENKLKSNLDPVQIKNFDKLFGINIQQGSGLCTKEKRNLSIKQRTTISYFIIPIIIFKIFRINMYYYILQKNNDITLYNILQDLSISLFMIMILYLSKNEKIAILLFTDLLVSLVLIYIVLFTYKTRNITEKNRANLEFFIKIILITPFFVFTI